jgi:hypothetical protein
MYSINTKYSSIFQRHFLLNFYLKVLNTKFRMEITRNYIKFCIESFTKLCEITVHLTAFICVKSCQRIERSLKNIRAVEIIRIKCKKYTWEKVCMLGKNRRNIR